MILDTCADVLIPATRAPHRSPAAMIRYERASPGDLSAGPPPPGGFRVAEGSPIAADIGLAPAAILYDETSARGAAVVAGGTVQDFAEATGKALDGALRKLAAMGSSRQTLEAGVFGGTETAAWQLDRLRKLLQQRGLRVRMLEDTGGRQYRTFRFVPRSGRLAVAHEREDPSHWSPAASALGFEDGVRVFRQNAASGKVANATRFFREKKSFRGLREQVVPEYLAEGGRRPFTLWSACCSSGEETYSYAMYLLRQRRRARAPMPLRIVGTDVNEACLERGRTGVYEVPQQDVQEYGAYFRRYGELRGLRFTAGEELRAAVRFRPFDIRHVPRRHRFRVIICANVFQYYNDEARLRFLRNFVAASESPGYIYVNNVRRETVEELGLEFLPAYGFVRVP
jgi:chemotaxis methyl-accepting protein methylase